MIDYIIRYADGGVAHVQASSVASARNRGYNMNRSGSIIDVRKAE
jgi:hypothetical protein